MNHIPLSLLRQFAKEKRVITRHCEQPSCTQTTREGKPYCPDHIELNPYVQALLSTNAGREIETEAAEKKQLGKIDVDGVTCLEILQHLKHNGARTEERLVREINISAKAMNSYLTVLRRAGLITLGTTKRGSTVVKLAKPRAAKKDEKKKSSSKVLPKSVVEPEAPVPPATEMPADPTPLDDAATPSPTSKPEAQSATPKPPPAAETDAA